MWQYPDLDPVAISLGPIAIHWYAVSYLVGIALVWWTVLVRIRRHSLDWNEELLSDLLLHCVLGVILGGRVGFMLFYGTQTLLDDPLALFKIWEGGMSFHGGLLGVALGAYVFARRRGRHFFDVTDMIAPSIPLALGCGRIGNFINGELPGRITEVPWAVIYPGDLVGRHPSSLYQATLEGPLLFALMWWYASKPRQRMAVSGMFLAGYGLLRICSEFFREPDPHIGFALLGWVTAGQLLSLPMLLIGAWMLVTTRGPANQRV